MSCFFILNAILFLTVTTPRLGNSEARCLDCADMMAEPEHSFHLTLKLVDQYGYDLEVGLGADEAVRVYKQSYIFFVQTRLQNKFFGIEAREASLSRVVWEKLTDNARPWLGNFWKGRKEERAEWYNSEEYLDLAVQAWQVKRDGQASTVYTICGTRLTASTSSQMQVE